MSFYVLKGQSYQILDYILESGKLNQDFLSDRIRFFMHLYFAVPEIFLKIFKLHP
jgi:hypothetical protein